MILKPSPVSTDHFVYDPAARLLVADASDLRLGHSLDFGRVYDDAADIGLTLVSHHTGREVVYAIEHAERRDGDLLYWDLRPANAYYRDLPSVRIFND